MKKINKILAKLGPGFVTGAADDDPSGIATYSIAGARFGYRLNWLSLFLIPMMISVQEMCGRIGMCAGTGLTGAIKKHYSRKLLFAAVSLLCFANIFNIGANLSVMAESIKMVFGLNFLFWLISVTILCIGLEIFVPYKKYVSYLKIMGLSLLSYFLTTLITGKNWVEVIRFTLIPHIDLTPSYIMTAVAFIGTTISPYLFFWQASEEVEEEIKNREVRDFYHKPHIKKSNIISMRRDTAVGMVFSNFISMCIILTSASTLHQNGIYNILTPHDAALALKPLAGDMTYFLFMFGIVSIGLQSIPILAGSIAYSLSEVFGFKEGLGKKPAKAKAFYAIIAISTGIGAIINIAGIDSIKALFYTAIINGLVSVPLIAIIIKLADDPRVVGPYKTPRKNKIIARITLGFVALASTLMLISLLI